MEQQILDHNLTTREKEIGECLLKGMSSKLIAKKLGISIHTVEIYRKNIRLRLGCKNSCQLGFLLSKLLINK